MAMITCKECGTEISSKAAKCPKCGAPAKKRTSLVTWFIVVVIGVVAAGVLMSPDSGDQPARPNAVAKPRVPTAYDLAKRDTTLNYQARKAGLGNVLEVDFTVTNASVVTIKDIAVTCIMYAKSGTQVDTNRRTIYDTIQPGTTKRFPKFNMGFMHDQANSSSCYIADLVVN